jgi:hypothetical protein
VRLRAYRGTPQVDHRFSILPKYFSMAMQDLSIFVAPTDGLLELPQFIERKWRMRGCR